MIFLSLGAGVQSSTLALMAAAGEFGVMPDAAIFADTMAEPVKVYRHLEYLRRALPFPIIVVSAGNLMRDALAGVNSKGKAFDVIPWHIPGGIGRRQCTREYKLAPIYRYIRSLGASRKSPVELWIGISTDEAHRMKPARVQYVRNRWPLIEKRMTRGHCLEWLRERSIPKPPKSSCVFCPYRGSGQWQSLSNDEMAAAIIVDYAIRSRGEQYAWSGKAPLDEADFTTPASAGQVDAFGEECEGICGT